MYTAQDFEKDIQNVKPRIFDTYILPAFMVGYAVKSKGMPKTARRILFTAAVYMTYRNYSIYKKQFLALRARFDAAKQDTPEDTVAYAPQEEPPA